MPTAAGLIPITESVGVSLNSTDCLMLQGLSSSTPPPRLLSAEIALAPSLSSALPPSAALTTSNTVTSTTTSSSLSVRASPQSRPPTQERERGFISIVEGKPSLTGDGASSTAVQYTISPQQQLEQYRNISSDGAGVASHRFTTVDGGELPGTETQQQQQSSMCSVSGIDVVLE